ncbi:MAG: transposase [Acidobacteria bacterium]|nr:transposase [Acidobacteriota bacterium]MBS1866284.1 transposase [Acidobacteriota bacterium]
MGRLTHRTSPGWTYFVTTKCAQNVSVFQVRENAEILIAKLFEYRDKGHYLLHGFVVMPNHLHLLITPLESTSLERAMQFMKGGSSYAIHKARCTKNEIWQSGFHESRVRDSAEYKVKADYIRFNPITAKLVEKPEDWPYSSANELFVLDPIPQGLKPHVAVPPNVGAKAPTPKTLSKAALA